MQSTNVQSTNVQSTNVQSTNVELTNEQVEAAAKDKIITYPETIRQRKYPIKAGAEYHAISFALLKEPRNGVHGFYMIKAVGSTAEECDSTCKKILREVDSKNKNFIGRSGVWLPVTMKEDLSQDIVEVDTDNTQANKLKGLADDERDEEEKRQRREILEREEQLKKESTKPYTGEELDDYIRLRVSLRQNYLYLAEMKSKCKQFNSIISKLEVTRRMLEEKFPTYTVDWIDQYNKSRKESGLDLYDENNDAELNEALKEIKLN